jgi:predicted TIM-barrel fold metal-dependent hydrolase
LPFSAKVVFFPYLERAAQELPAEKLLFGSDGPLVDPRLKLFKVWLLKLSPGKEDLVVGCNIRRVLRH